MSAAAGGEARISYTLKHPIVSREIVDGEVVDRQVTVLHLSPVVKGRHMRAVDQARGQVEAKLFMIAALADISRSDTDDLAEVDFLAIDALYESDSDMARLVVALSLPRNAGIEDVLAAIAALCRANRGGEAAAPLAESTAGSEAGSGGGDGFPPSAGGHQTMRSSPPN